MLSISRSRFKAITILLVMFIVFQVSEGDITKSKQCIFPGYAPGSVANPKNSRINIQPKQFEESVMKKVLTFVTKDPSAHEDYQTAMKVAEMFEEAPMIGGALSIIAKSLGFLDEEPSADEILNKAQQSVLLLQDEINTRLDQLHDYVDSKDLESERRITTAKYKELFDKWSKCARKATKEDANRCQRSAEEDIDSARFHFQQKQTMFDDKDWKGKTTYSPKLGGYRYVATWQWMNNYCGSRFQCPSHYDVKLIESGLIGFRDYASLHLLSLATLAATYKGEKGKDVDACTYYQHYMEKMEKKATYYVEYVKWAYEWIYIRQYEENMYFGVPRRAGGGPDSAERGGFLGTINCYGNKCTAECSQMIKDNLCTVQGASKVKLTEEVSKTCEDYMYKGMKDALVKFWTQEVLNLSKIWEKYRDEAKNFSC